MYVSSVKALKRTAPQDQPEPSASAHPVASPTDPTAAPAPPAPPERSQSEEEGSEEEVDTI